MNHYFTFNDSCEDVIKVSEGGEGGRRFIENGQNHVKDMSISHSKRCRRS